MNAMFVKTTKIMKQNKLTGFFKHRGNTEVDKFTDCTFFFSNKSVYMRSSLKNSGFYRLVCCCSDAQALKG